MQDLTQYSDQELSLIVFNDGYLYNQRHKAWLMDIINEMYRYTPEQLAELEQDLEDDSNEEI